MRRAATNPLIAIALMTVGAFGLKATTGPTPGAMTTAATHFLASLTPAQRQQATFAFDTSERTRWNFIPTESFPRNGLTIKQMSQPQRALAHELLKTGLSQRGYMTATQIMELESVLGTLEAGMRAAGTPPGPTQFLRDSERYFFSIFGTPAEKSSWGWRVEGHHVSLHFTVVNGSLVAGSPSFFGSNPAEVRSGPRQGARILGGEEDAGRSLVGSLDATQREQALINGIAPNDIVTGSKVKIDPLSPVGIPASALTPSQLALLRKLVVVYAEHMASDIAADRLARIQMAGWDKITFAWAGSVERGQKHYYRVQGPTFLIEYDNTQNDGNHVHSVWRDFDRDFGADLLRQHVTGASHEY